VPHKEFVDLGLRVRRVTWPFTHIDQERVASGFDEELASNQAVVDHHVGLAEEVQAADRDQARITGTAADKVHCPNRHR
jgi:hypothetical protein